MYRHISHIVLQNFQSIKTRTRVDFAPITLLYGPNSAGKSAIFDAVRLGMRLCGKFEPFTNLGDIEDDIVRYLHQHNYDEKMLIGIGAPNVLPSDWCRPPVVSTLAEDDWLASFGYSSEESFDALWEVLFEFSFYHHTRKDGYPLTTVTPMINEIIISEAGEKLIEINLQSEFIRINIIHPAARKLIQAIEMREGSFSELCEVAFDHERYSISRSHLLIHGGIDTEVYATLPETIWQHPSPLASNKSVDSHRASQVILWLLQLLIFSPMEAIHNQRGYAHIGPTRRIPRLSDLTYYAWRNKLDADRNWASPTAEYEPHWTDGTEAWCRLAASANVHDWPGARCLVDAINDWLIREDRLNIGYNVALEYRAFDETPWLIPKGSIRGYRETTSMERADGMVAVRIVDTRLKSLVSIGEVGTGISQLMPILVASYTNLQNFFEQPELHLHPRVQAVLGDLFVSRWNCDFRRFILESHSEMLALRMLRRIRETAKSDIKHPQLSLRSEDIAFIFFNPKEDETEVTKLRVSSDGEFLDRWPKGFFAEREAELFDEDD